MHDASMIYMKRFLDEYLYSGAHILDVGSRRAKRKHPIYKDLIPRGEAISYVGLDIRGGNNVDLVVSDPYRWKELPDNEFTHIISGQAIEHMKFFWMIIDEMNRVLTSKGKVCLITPWKEKIHRYPVDCWRILPDGMRALAEYVGWEVVSAEIFSGSHFDTVGIFRKP